MEPKKLAVIIDVQVDFVMSDGALAVPDAEKLLPHYAKYFSQITPENGYIGVLFSFDTHYINEYPLTEESKEFPPHCLLSTPGWSLACKPNGISTEVPLWMAKKGYFSLWKENVEVHPYPKPRNSDPIMMDAFLTSHVAGCVIEVVGVASDVCVRYAIEGFLERGFVVRTDTSLCAGLECDITKVIASMKEANHSFDVSCCNLYKQ